MKDKISRDDIEESILSCMCYFDGFDYPLKIKEIHSFIPGVELSLESLRTILSEYPLNELILQDDGYYYLFDRDSEIISLRVKSENIAASRWQAAQRMGKIIKMFPYVRAVMVSGDLSKNVSSEESDIDYFILTEPGRLWVTRTLLILFKKIVLLNDRTYYCLNFFRTTNNLSFESTKDYFTAIELFTLTSLYNSEMTVNVLEENRWAYSYFPNYKQNGMLRKYTSDSRSMIQVLAEKLLSIFSLAHLDNRIMDYMKKAWRKRYPELTDEEIAYRFRCTANESTAFGEESKRDIMKQHELRFNQIKKQLHKKRVVSTNYD